MKSRSERVGGVETASKISSAKTSLSLSSKFLKKLKKKVQGVFLLDKLKRVFHLLKKKF